MAAAPQPPERCPSRDELAAFTVGALPLSRLEVVARHAERCPRCQVALEHLQRPGDLLVQSLRQPLVEDPFADEPECRELAERLRASTVAGDAGARPARSPGLQALGFEINALVGHGPSGVVYRATEASTGRAVALKVMPFGPGAVARQRYLEANRLAVIQPGSRVLPVDSLGEADDGIVAVMPYAGPMHLGQLIALRRSFRREAPIGAPTSLAVCDDREYVAAMVKLLDSVIETVAALHRLAWTFPELKPSNCVPADPVWLTDFGLNRLLPRPTAVLALPRGANGSDVALAAPGYASPEEWAGSPTQDARTDVFRLGVLLYHTLTLELPYGTAPVTTRKPSPTPATQRQALLAPALSEVVSRALKTDPVDRYPSAVELWQEWAALRPQVKRESLLSRFFGLVRRRRKQRDNQTDSG